MKKLISLLLVAVLCIFGTAAMTGCNEKTDWAYIEGKGEMVMGITLFRPMNYYEDENESELVGFETEFAKAVCDKLGVTARFQVIDWKSKETELNSKNIDCIWNGMTIDEDRLASMDISTPYISNKQVLVAKAENATTLNTAEALKDKEIVAEMGSAGETVATSDALLSGSKFTAVDTMSKALMEVQSGTADACVIDYVTTLGSIGEGTDYADLAVVENTGFDYSEEYGIAFRKNSPDTLARVNEAIQQLADEGTLQEIAKKYKLENELLIKAS